MEGRGIRRRHDALHLPDDEQDAVLHDSRVILACIVLG